jgi:hypothetical protein
LLFFSDEQQKSESNEMKDTHEMKKIEFMNSPSITLSIIEIFCSTTQRTKKEKSIEEEEAKFIDAWKLLVFSSMMMS